MLFAGVGSKGAKKHNESSRESGCLDKRGISATSQSLSISTLLLSKLLLFSSLLTSILEAFGHLFYLIQLNYELPETIELN